MAPKTPQSAANDAMEDAAEALWAVVANVDGGDWTRQDAHWQKGAARARDLYRAALGKLTKPRPPVTGLFDD